MIRSIRNPGMVLVAAGLVSCYQYRAHALQSSPGPQPQSRMVWSFVWGVAGTQPTIDCDASASLAEVTVKDNFAFTLLTLVTVGLVSPKRVEWQCAAPMTCPGRLETDSTSEHPDSTRGG